MPIDWNFDDFDIEVETPKLVTRDIIGGEITRDTQESLGFVYDGHSLNDVYHEIDKTKNLLINAGAKKGDLVTIGIMVVDITHIGAIFACAELGLKVFILDSPATLESLPFTKLALHGPSDFHIHNSQEPTEHIYNGLHDEMMKRYGGVGIDVLEGDDTTYRTGEEVYPSDPFIVSSTSGTTGPSKPVLFSHEETMTLSERNAKVFEFKTKSKVIHSRNLHHVSAMLTHLLPALMYGHCHSSFAIGHDGSYLDTPDYRDGVADMHKETPSHIMIPNKKELHNFLSMIRSPFKYTAVEPKQECVMNINMCGFAMDEEFVQIARDYNVCFMSHYGSIDTAIPLLVNRVDKDSVIVENSLGVLPDDYYKTTLENGRMKVEHPLWDEPRYLEDDLEYVDGYYIIHPKKRNDIEIPEGFDISPFFIDTKINYEQLRGHLHTISP